MIEMLTSCGRCSYYTEDHRCGNPESDEFGRKQFSNVCWKCPCFDGELYPWDDEKAVPMGDRPSTFGRVDPRDPHKFISEREYEELCKKGR